MKAAILTSHPIKIFSQKQALNDMIPILNWLLQVVTFLILLNLVVWGAYTFGLQNPTTTIQELRYYGRVASSNHIYIWIVLQRVIIPIIIFFRFHSLVMLVECWKNTYRTEETKDFLVLKLTNFEKSSELRELVASRLEKSNQDAWPLTLIVWHWLKINIQLNLFVINCNQNPLL